MGRYQYVDCTDFRFDLFLLPTNNCLLFARFSHGDALKLTKKKQKLKKETPITVNTRKDLNQIRITELFPSNITKTKNCFLRILCGYFRVLAVAY